MRRLAVQGWIRSGGVTSTHLRLRSPQHRRAVVPIRPVRPPENVKGKQMNFWDFFWLLIWSYVIVAYLILLFHIIADVFRDREMGGFAKALWMIVLIVAPFLGALIYLIARGRGMAERQAGAVRQAQAETEQYIQSVAAST